MGEGVLAGHSFPAPRHLTLQTVGSLQACLRGAQLFPHPFLWLGDRSGRLFIPPHTPLPPGFTWHRPQPLASPLTYFQLDWTPHCLGSCVSQGPTRRAEAARLSKPRMRLRSGLASGRYWRMGDQGC